MAPTAPTQNLVMVTSNGTTSTNSKVTALAALFAGWGWNVTAIDDNATSGQFTDAAESNNVMFVTDTVSSGAGDSVRGLDVGIVNEAFVAIDRLMYTSTGDQSWSSQTTVTIVDDTHPITTGFSTGSLTVHTSATDVNYWTESATSFPAGITVLADSPTSSDHGALFVAETGATLYSSNTAANRRVWFPSDAASPSVFTTDYETLLQRSLEWAAGLTGACGAADSDSDSDGLLDCEEDANTDADDDPATNPGPDTDGDTTPNYLDADDDGDGTPTASEDADPNGDGDPRDARDSDRNGTPDYLEPPTGASNATVASDQKISNSAGGLSATLDSGDSFGDGVATLGDIDGDGVVDIAVGATSDDDGANAAGAVYVLRLNADGTVKAEQKIANATGGLNATIDEADAFGGDLGGIGDIDGDGIGDLAVGAISDDDGASSAGAVYILFLNADGTVKAEQKISNTAGGLSTTLDASDRFGSSITGLGDVDGDGVRDIAVGAILDSDGAGFAGAVYVLFLNADGTVKAEQKISNTARRIHRSARGVRLLRLVGGRPRRPRR